MFSAVENPVQSPYYALENPKIKVEPEFVDTIIFEDYKITEHGLLKNKISPSNSTIKEEPKEFLEIGNFEDILGSEIKQEEVTCEKVTLNFKNKTKNISGTSNSSNFNKIPKKKPKQKFTVKFDSWKDSKCVIKVLHDHSYHNSSINVQQESTGSKSRISKRILNENPISKETNHKNPKTYSPVHPSKILKSPINPKDPLAFLTSTPTASHKSYKITNKTVKLNSNIIGNYIESSVTVEFDRILQDKLKRTGSKARKFKNVKAFNDKKALERKISQLSSSKVHADDLSSDLFESKMNSGLDTSIPKKEFKANLQIKLSGLDVTKMTAEKRRRTEDSTKDFEFIFENSKTSQSADSKKFQVCSKDGKMERCSTDIQDCFEKNFDNSQNGPQNDSEANANSYANPVASNLQYLQKRTESSQKKTTQSFDKFSNKSRLKLDQMGSTQDSKDFFDSDSEHGMEEDEDGVQFKEVELSKVGEKSENFPQILSNCNALKCPTCPLTFSDTLRLNRHKRLHIAPKFQCRNCLRKFKRESMLEKHICDIICPSCSPGDCKCQMDCIICAKINFRYFFDYKRHMKSHHNEIVVCKICEGNNYTLFKHKQLKHEVLRIKRKV